MHEGHFTEQIVEAILSQLKDRESSSVTRVKVSVGEMYHLNPESVKMHFAAMTKATPLEQTLLELDELAVIFRCKSCGRREQAEDHHLLVCSDCGSRNVEILQGDRVEITEMELESR